MGPILSVINLFIMILQSPEEHTDASDLALLDFCAGYFAWIRIVTESKISIPLVKELAKLAQNFHENYVKSGKSTSLLLTTTSLSDKAKDTESTQCSRSDLLQGGAACPTEESPSIPNFGDQQIEDTLLQISEESSFGVDLEYWSTFLPEMFDNESDDFTGAERHHLHQDQSL